MTWTDYPEDANYYGGAFYPESMPGLVVPLAFRALAQTERDAKVCAYIHMSLNLSHAGFDVPWASFREA